MVPFFYFLFFFFVEVRGQYSPNTSDSMAGFQPTLAFVIAMLSIMFSITFVLLLYAKFCHRPVQIRRRANRFHEGFLRSWRRSSGLDKEVVDSLPFFRFESLKGAKEGLECCVCLAKFEDVEVLRLLPKCKHAFHIDCIDSWLDKHSTCPLCRQRITPEDLLLSSSSRSFRFPSGRSDLYVQREESRDWSFGRFGIGDRREEAPLCVAVDRGGGGENLHKVNHTIFEEESLHKRRWSSMSSPDLILLSSKMITDVSRVRIPTRVKPEIHDGDLIINIKEVIERKRALDHKFTEISRTHHAPPFIGDSSLTFTNTRSLSDIAFHPRFPETNARRSSAGGGIIRRPEIQTKPELLTQNSTAAQPNRRVVNI